MPKFNEAEAARLQAIVDADPAIQAAIEAYRKVWVQGGGKDQLKAAKRNLDAALDRNPVLRAAGVAKDTIREGYMLNTRNITGRNPDGSPIFAPASIIREGSDVGHIVRDMILPAAGAGAILAAPAIFGSQAAAGGSSAGSGAPVAGTSTMSGSIAGPTTAQTIAGAGYGGGGGGGLLGGLGKILNPRSIAAGLGAISSGQAHNRGEEFGGQLDLQHAQLAREQENRMGGLDAWRRLLMAQRTLSPGPRPQLSPYSVAPRQATADELSGANAMTREVMARLQGGPSPLTVDPRLLRPGRGERFLGYTAPVLEGVGRVLGY